MEIGSNDGPQTVHQGGGAALIPPKMHSVSRVDGEDLWPADVAPIAIALDPIGPPVARVVLLRVCRSALQEDPETDGANALGALFKACLATGVGRGSKRAVADLGRGFTADVTGWH